VYPPAHLIYDQQQAPPAQHGRSQQATAARLIKPKAANSIFFIFEFLSIRDEIEAQIF